MSKKIKLLFLTGTRADFGKLKTLMKKIEGNERYELLIFVTGMHLLSKYGYTCEEVEKEGFQRIHKFINQNSNDSMDHILSKTIMGLSDYIHENSPDMLIIHGDRVEALAGAAVGALNNILVGHIEGGEVSGTVDELIRHSVTKLSNVHFVSNIEAQKRLLQLGESEESIYVIGSPDVDVMNSDTLPTLANVKERYGFDFSEYAILLFHPVTTEIDSLKSDIRKVVDSVISSNKNFIVIYPNNDLGSDIIIEEYERLRTLKNIRIYPSMRFEYFLTLLKNASFMVGNSSAGVREAPHYGVPSVNLGTRQFNRVNCDSVINCSIDSMEISDSFDKVLHTSRERTENFGIGNSAEKFLEILDMENFWRRNSQKYFIDREFV
ncbi:UDP-N-acetylglucosamine 2-epimerase (hydrolyzing) [Leptospira congkakensis]|uniref:UDP-N-acetylglucosamine 2-epimerase (Hydrolyzing) n=1 Tax=Leptospira congkakensis TaxID=2484932 RepID=A0A4Z1A5P7_9LEPT|nr:UDP-N-acetylglucosamine 2-epimerase [Leptospira congkakensis]TGL90226.1 UDP-N-acetylglucosamine 2-epimerase (hydrolyzing) [Leptospira congkakensis]TGL91232.1 UDP-N-acetylglucosamine 2-epimerase (hydrolyzing) [Leptospira congkakensis]TGL98284.1 UDP-N-acetylglucosamine 2-epimerase (hydrolyzing) [Leptospira congkakensis]